MPANVLAKTRASLISLFSHRAAANAPLKASPAPEVSTTLPSKFKAGTKNFSSLFSKYTPFSPRVITTFFIPRSNKSLDESLASFSLLISLLT